MPSEQHKLASMKLVVLDNKVAREETSQGFHACLAGVWSDVIEKNQKRGNGEDHAIRIKKYSGRDFPIGIEISMAKTGKLVRKKCQKVLDEGGENRYYTHTNPPS
jgi:hypothetical protein